MADRSIEVNKSNKKLSKSMQQLKIVMLKCANCTATTTKNVSQHVLSFLSTMLSKVVSSKTINNLTNLLVLESIRLNRLLVDQTVTSLLFYCQHKRLNGTHELRF